MLCAYTGGFCLPPPPLSSPPLPPPPLLCPDFSRAEEFLLVNGLGVNWTYIKLQDLKEEKKNQLMA